jgi:hypothetical protein
MYKVLFYRDRQGNSDVVDYLDTLKASGLTSKTERVNRTKILAYIGALEQYGTRIGMPIVRASHAINLPKDCETACPRSRRQKGALRAGSSPPRTVAVLPPYSSRSQARRSLGSPLGCRPSCNAVFCQRRDWAS